MLRVPQHERKNINDINSPPFVLSAVEGLLGFFSNLLVSQRFNLLATVARLRCYFLGFYCRT
jgi:hypothetical protein